MLKESGALLYLYFLSVMVHICSGIESVFLSVINAYVGAVSPKTLSSFLHLAVFIGTSSS